MKCYNKFITLALIFFLLESLFSCRSSKNIDHYNDVYIENKKYDNYSDFLKADKKDNAKLYKEVRSWIGTPYLYGGHSKKGTDCSGFVMEIYKNIYHISIERNSKSIFEQNCKKINKSQLKEGDLIFFTFDNKNGKINHVGLYLKEGKFVHATSSKGVVISDLDNNYYKLHYYASARVIS